MHAIEEINVLSGKMDELMKLFANKNTLLDPNDMPLSTLIENNNESMDVNFVGRNYFGNNTYRGNFPNNSLISMVVPTIILMVILIRCPLILRIGCKTWRFLKRILMLFL